MNKMDNGQKGVIHLLLLVIVFAAIGLIILAMVFKPDLAGLKGLIPVQKTGTTLTPTPSVAPSDTNLEKEVNAQELTDPSDDFTQVDQDINSL